MHLSGPWPKAGIQLVHVQFSQKFTETRNGGLVSLDLCSIVSKVMLGLVRLGYGGLGAVMLG